MKENTAANVVLKYPTPEIQREAEQIAKEMIECERKLHGLKARYKELEKTRVGTTVTVEHVTRQSAPRKRKADWFDKLGYGL